MGTDMTVYDGGDTVNFSKLAKSGGWGSPGPRFPGYLASGSVETRLGSKRVTELPSLLKRA